MRIDPKTFTFDALQRPLIISALFAEMEAKESRLSALRLTQRAKPTDKRAEDIDRLEMDVARIEDMLTTLKAAEG